MMRWLNWLRTLPEYRDLHEIHLILDCYAAHRCTPVKELAKNLNITLHFIPPGLTDLLQPLDLAVFGALKAEYRAIYRFEMSQRDDKRMAKADFAAFLILAWELVSVEAVRSGWACYSPDGGLLQGDWEDDGDA